MTSFFTRDLLKRPIRTPPRKAIAPRPRHSLDGKVLHIIPEIPEHAEGEELPSCSTSHSEPSPFIRTPSPSQSSHSCNNEGTPSKSRRRHGIVKLSDISLPGQIEPLEETHDNHTFIFSPPPRRKTSFPTLCVDDQIIDGQEDEDLPASPDSFNVCFPEMGISFTFPHPPLPTPPIASPKSLDIPPSSRSPRCGWESPTPSLSSSNSSSSRSHITGLPATPSASDDEFQSIFPLEERRHVSLQLPKHNTGLGTNRMTSCGPMDLHPSIQVQSDLDDLVQEADSDSDDVGAWYSREMSEILTLYSPIPPSSAARPESITSPPMPGNHKRSRLSKPLPDIPFALPSPQLDPMFPRRQRSAGYTPRPAPPPVPVIPPHLIEGLRGARRPSAGRPPPRISVPADVLCFDAIEDDNASVYSQDAQSLTINSNYECSLEQVKFDLDLPMQFPVSLPNTPLDLDADILDALHALSIENRESHRASLKSLSASTLLESPIDEFYVQKREPAIKENIKTLQSRWSSDTLASLREDQHLRIPTNGASSRLKMYFGGGAAKKRRESKTVVPALPSPLTPQRKLRRESNAWREAHSSSTSDSGHSEWSGDSFGGSMKRKPIHR